MPYRDSLVRDLRKVSKRCFECNKLFAKNEYKATHSASGLHLELEEVGVPPRYVYRATDTSGAFSYMKGKTLETNEFIFGFRYFADAVCVCNHCHIQVHSLALELCVLRIPDFKGNTPLPRLLVEATFNFNKYKRFPAK